MNLKVTMKKIKNFPDILKEFFKGIFFTEFKHTFTGVGEFFKSNPFTNGMFDIFYFIIVIVLTVIGLAMHYSASYLNAEQMLFAIAGIFVMLIASQVRVGRYRSISAFFLAVATVLMFGALLKSDYNGTHRWFLGIQPSELAKIAFIMCFAYFMDRYKRKLHKTGSFYVFAIMTGIYAVILILQSHLSGCILFFCIGVSMMWLSGEMSRKQFAFWGALAVIAIAIVVWKPTAIPLIKSYQAKRIVIWKKIFLGQELTKSERIEDARQVLQSVYGIGSGGMFGTGFGNSGQKVSNLSEKANDFIFAVIGEELGFVGSIAIIAIFAVLVYRGFVIGSKSRSMYGKMVCYGVSVQMALQVLINISVATSLLPNTGISLPFFSEGGSSMLFTMLSMGVVLAISRDNKDYEAKNSKAVEENEE